MRATRRDQSGKHGERCGAASPSVCALTLLLLAAICSLPVMLSGCVDTRNDQPTPEQSKRYLKLRGFTFDEQSFFSAAAAGEVAVVKAFLTAGINPNARDKSDETALIGSASRGDLGVVKALLQGGADINAGVRGGYTALLLALMNKRDEVADLLLQ